MATIDPDAYSVYYYETGERAEGAPTEELVKESLSAGHTGAVLATYDRDEAQWQYMPADEADNARAQGERVRKVYVSED